MGEGEVCLAVVSNVGEMENEKIQQKRDHQWLMNGSDAEPLAKKQVKEGSVEVEVDICARNKARVALGSIEQEPCAKTLPLEEFNGVRLELFVEQDIKECSDEMELEPCSKNETTETQNEIEPESCARNQSGVVTDSIEQEPCAKILPTEGLNGVKLEPSVEQNKKECSNEMELEPCVKKQAETLSEIKSEPFVWQAVKECSNEMELEVCERKHAKQALNDTEIESRVTKQATEALDDTELGPVNECSNETRLEVCERKQAEQALNDTEIEPCDTKQSTEALNDTELEPSVQQPVKECLNEKELGVCERKQAEQALNDTEMEPCVTKQATELSVQQPVKECLNEMELGVCEGKQEEQALNDTEMEPCVTKEATEALNDTEMEPCVTKQATDTLNDTELEPSVEQPVKECPNETVLDPCSKKEVKEASNDDICSEVSNPNVSPRDNSSSFQTVSSQPDGKLVIKDQVVCGEITSACSGNSSSEGSSSQEHGTNGTSTSHVVLEVPKHASTSSGIRKITFKFSKRKEDYDSQLSASAAQSMGTTFDNGTRKVPRLTHISEQGLHETSDSLLYPSNMETTSGKVVPEGYPTTVKRLLSTGFLDGAKVKYISSSGELIGIVKDSGYLCGCEACNFSNILRAHEFEEHAGGKTRHPNNHIYLENGKPIYHIVQEMKSAPLSTVDETIKNIAGSSVNEELLQVWKENLQRNMDRSKTDSSHHMKLMNLYHSTTSCTSHTGEDASSPYFCYRKSFALEPQTFVNETTKERKRPFKKSRSNISNTSVETKRSAEGGHKKRDNDLHRLLFMPNGLPDGTELAYYARGKKILDGYKQGNGIVCSHCDTEISPSQFEAHAGWAAKRQPYRHIYISNGLTLHDIALLLANGQSIATSNSDDMCAVCGDRGELIICDGCPRAFHAVCLGLDGVPTEGWNCAYCRDNIGSGRKAAAGSRPIVIRLTRVVKAREYETGGCVICRAHDFSVAEFDDRTVMLCDQCEKEYHVGCLRESGICDLKALPSDKWFCCDHCDMIHGAIQEVVANGASGISASVLSTINKKHIEKGVFDGVPNQIRWRMLSGKSRYPEHLPLLSRAAAIFRECFDPIVAKSGRDLIPVMVYGRNISGQEFGGIYCVVLMVGSVVVSAGLLRIFGREVAELPLVATSRQHQGKGYFQALFFCIEELLLSLGVEMLVLPAAEEAESIWTKKLGFRKMSDDQYTQYSRDIQLTIFKGTSMLEKEMRRSSAI